MLSPSSRCGIFHELHETAVNCTNDGPASPPGQAGPLLRRFRMKRVLDFFEFFGAEAQFELEFFQG